MDEATAERLVNGIVYDIDRVEDLEAPEHATDCVNAMFEGKYFIQPPAEFLEALDIVVPSGHLSEATLSFSHDYDEQQLLAFLARVGDELRSRLASQSS